MTLFPESFKPVSVSPAPTTSIFALHHSAQTSSPRKVLLLIHGFPQNHTLYHVFVSELSKLGLLNEWDVVIPDVPGYGKSRKPASADGRHYAHSKRAIGEDCVGLIDALYSPGQEFYVAGHDRGARVAYRMAADCSRVKGACLMEIVPTKSMWASMKPEDGHKETFRSAHWIYLALPSPLPEIMLGSSSDAFFKVAFVGMTGAGFKDSDAEGNIKLKFAPEALESWVTQYRDPLVLQGSLEDYRAGASMDIEHDSDPNSSVSCPLLILHASHLSARFDVEAIWKAERVDTTKLTVKHVGNEDTGHFIPYEAAEDCAIKLTEWLVKL